MAAARERGFDVFGFSPLGSLWLGRCRNECAGRRTTGLPSDLADFCFTIAPPPRIGKQY
jgi:hypothetical protein